MADVVKDRRFSRRVVIKICPPALWWYWAMPSGGGGGREWADAGEGEVIPAAAYWARACILRCLLSFSFFSASSRAIFHCRRVYAANSDL